MRVLITGASGVVGTVLSERLPGRYQLSALDRVPQTSPRYERETVADVADLSAILPAMAGQQAIVHLAGDSRVEAPWESVLTANIVGTRNVLEAARQSGVRRIVFASSNHVVGMYEYDSPYSEIVAGKRIPGADTPQVDHRATMRPDSDYGASKAAGEAMCRQYWERFGIESVALRIGTVTRSGHPECIRHLATWLSPSDLTGLVEHALTAERVGFAVVYGVSANRRRFWSLESARTELDFEPVDNAEEYAASLDDDESALARRNS